MIRKIPLVPGYIMGIINVRGQIIPIIDMRLRIGKESATFDTSCIIILEIDSNLVGIAVDAVLPFLWKIRMNWPAPCSLFPMAPLSCF